MNEKTSMEKINVEIDGLKKIALFLEGVKLGRGGSIHPLGTHDLEQLWGAIAYLQGDVRYRLMDTQNIKKR